MTAAEVFYRERLHAPWGLWLAVAAMALACGLVALRALPPAGVVVTVAVAFALGAVALLATAAPVEVTAGHLRAGRARIPLEHVGEPVALDARTARTLRGAGFDASAYHLIRGWLPLAVRVPVTDPQDSTPYWYVATRRPEQLAVAIERARMSRTRDG
ncbi:MAG: DUF3093 domain-containing protein [Actinomycetota bacterium]|nr:DUF3093 domain-containing protein [Actinomycetota bacterium]